MKTVQKIVLSSMFAALVCVATMVIKIPSPLNGYINLGDCIVLISAWFLSPVYGFLAAGLGSALADVFSGYLVYAPATFVIKGLMALAAYFIFKSAHKKIGGLTSRIVSGFTAETIMVAGYFFFELAVYGAGVAIPDLLGNATQGIVAVITGTVLLSVFLKNRKLYSFFE